VVRDAETIQAEIERARDGLAAAVDELTTRANPQRMVDEGKRRALAIWQNPKVKYPVIGVGALIAVLLIRKLLR
jgi:hypothetical protein